MQYEKALPLFDRILVKRVDTENTTEGGIVIPDTAKEKPFIAEVLECGPTVKQVKSGDHVLFSKYAGTEMDLNGETLLILSEEDVLAVLS